eukprot:2767431-Pleurochrysis_carterae.AAC.2
MCCPAPKRPIQCSAYAAMYATFQLRNALGQSGARPSAADDCLCFCYNVVGASAVLLSCDANGSISS